MSKNKISFFALRFSYRTSHNPFCVEDLNTGGVDYMLVRRATDVKVIRPIYQWERDTKYRNDCSGDSGHCLPMRPISLHSIDADGQSG